ncbi:MAG: PorV/PorQ family protein [Ignavibacteria bacterium]|jgi:opacity protein-like surface antigen|nr:PorV/PorQ family protein [Ignavibacteria bacterium]MCU7498542.1 PorV/PorQ family protein [Ignavibacteria bacterium]MCU7511657.1 PorV/PorQ family protein [Ignavibacteria bacterium]MCU7519129.1 PorV/PorQ family protein [Ignavibacteria bacterium]MCU7523759.1 PorV/PorQ family protein [Ignavibacteria bacterium]
MRKSLYLMILLAAFSFGQVNAQIFRDITKVGTTAAQFLKIGPGARAIGMGGAYTAVSNDIYSTYWNPAGIANSEGSGQVAFNHTQWLANVSYDYAAGSINLPEVGTMFVTLTSLGVPEEKVRTFENPEGDGRYWDAGSLELGFGFARKLTDRFSIGFQAKYIKESIWNSSANGFALDVGTYYITPFNDLVIGASISNFGSKMQLDGRDIQFNMDPNSDGNTGPNNIPAKYEMQGYDIPLNFKIGLSMDVIKTRYIRLKTAVDATHPNDNTEYVNAGAEFAYDETFFLRGGYKSLFLTDSEQSFTLGAGINYEVTPGFKIQVNYAYADFGRLKNIQYIDLGISF